MPCEHPISHVWLFVSKRNDNKQCLTFMKWDKTKMTYKKLQCCTDKL